MLRERSRLYGEGGQGVIYALCTVPYKQLQPRCSRRARYIIKSAFQSLDIGDEWHVLVNARNTSEKETTCSGQLLMKIVIAILRLVGVVKGVEPEHAPLQVPFRCP